MNEFVFLKLVNGEQVMALKESEDHESIMIRFPMLVKTHHVGFRENRIAEQVTAGPYTMFGENDHMVVSRSHVIFQTPLAERAIPHYVNLVKEHEGVNILYTPRVLQWDDEPPAEAPDSVDIKKVLDALKSIAEEEPSEDESKRNFIEGNKTIH